MGTFAGFFYRQLTIKPKPLPQNVRLDGKTAIITGANAGLGLEAAKELATHGLALLRKFSASIWSSRYLPGLLNRAATTWETLRRSTLLIEELTSGADREEN
ncbi:putative Tetrahydroxynaphthalene reductase [Glarea lozoyensis 74030]|uniref:Putative Tetrahydroxynaphthalene reductase n=1 Tax=Glarea lozoyensis (strain ATCC 74030 / MF5533) TaxID=1104152 RepID=H0ES02_GLAL7|nr:putative Tetrahydroxynaphthalene reductase [Glarea lozoyensis 74030]